MYKSREESSGAQKRVSEAFQPDLAVPSRASKVQRKREVQRCATFDPIKKRIKSSIEGKETSERVKP